MSIMIMILGAIILLGIAFGIAENARNIEHLEYVQAKQIESLTVTKAALEQRINNTVAGSNFIVDHYDKEFAEITKKLEDIAKDIGRLDAEMKYQQARMNTVYPWFENSEYNTKKNGGVPWAKEYPDQEEEHDQVVG